MDKKNFLIQMAFKEAVCGISDEAAGQVFKGLFNYVETGNKPTLKDAVANGVFLCFKSSIDEAIRRYDEQCNKNRENIKKRWNKERVQPNTNVYDRIQPNTNVYEALPNDYDNDNEDDNEERKEISSNQRLESKNLEKFSRVPLVLSWKDFADVQKLWNDICKSYRRVTKLTSKNPSRCNRKGKITECLKYISGTFGIEDKEQIKNELAKAFYKIEKSKFLKGENGNGWKADFDWVMKVEVLEKIINGNYDQ